MSEYALALAPLIGRRRIRDRSDEELLEAIGAGDEAALAALYDRFGRVAYGVALRILRDQALAEDAVQEAFGRLPADQRQALELAYYGGYTQSELAEHLGVPLGTVKSRMFAGLSRLRELVSEQ